MRAVDTNVLVRLLRRDDAHQSVLADAFIEYGAWVSILALAETIWVLQSVYERTRQEIATAVEMLLKHQSLTLQDSDAVAAALETFRKHPVSFADCLMLELARKSGNLPLGTFDRGLARIEGAVKL